MAWAQAFAFFGGFSADTAAEDAGEGKELERLRLFVDKTGKVRDCEVSGVTGCPTLREMTKLYVLLPLAYKLEPLRARTP